MNRRPMLMEMLACVTAVNCAAYEDVFSGTYCVQEAVRHLNHYSSGSRMDYSRAVGEWRIPSLGLATNGMHVTARSEVADGRHQIYLFEGNELLLHVQAHVCRSIGDAHVSLAKHFANMNVPRVWPCSTNDLGDVVFVFLPEPESYAAFRRNNVFVAVDSWMPSNNATNIARQIDASILRASGVEVE